MNMENDGERWMKPMHWDRTGCPASSTDLGAEIHATIKAMMRAEEEIANVHHDEWIEVQERISSVRSDLSKLIAVELFSHGVIHFHSWHVDTRQWSIPLFWNVERWWATRIRASLLFSNPSREIRVNIETWFIEMMFELISSLQWWTSGSEYSSVVLHSSLSWHWFSLRPFSFLGFVLGS